MTLRDAAVFMLLAFGCMAAPGPGPQGPATEPGASEPTPPKAAKRPKQLVAHGDTRVDDYYWLRDKSDPEVVAYLRAENEYTAAVTKPIEGLAQTLYREMVDRLVEDDTTVATPRGRFEYYSRTEANKQYPIYVRRPKSKAKSKSASGGGEQVLLDLNVLAKDHAFVGLGEYEPSPDETLLAYTLDTTGFRQHRLRIRDTATGKDLRHDAQRVTSLAWSASGKQLFFTVEDPVSKRSHRLFRWTLTDEAPELVYEEPDERFLVSVSLSRSKAWVLLDIASHTASEIRVAPADRPKAAFRIIAPRRAEHEYSVDHGGKWFYILTNDRGRNFRLVRAPVGSPGEDHWSELRPHDPAVMLERVAVFSNHYVVAERRGGLQQLSVVEVRGKKDTPIAFESAAYTLGEADNFEWDTREVRFRHQSPVDPPTTYAYDMKTGERRVLKREQVRGGFDPSSYTVARSHATADDGTAIPVTVVHRVGLEKNGDNPTLLRGYGAYGASYSPRFSSADVSLLDRGFVLAIAHIRGGGEMGKAWHDQGRMFNKMNSFTDFIAAAQFLIDDGYTQPKRLGISGGSAGGLLMGAVTNMRPDLFGAVVAVVPFVDVLTTMSDEKLPLTVGEFEEWGNPKIEDQYRYMRRYCPYSNVDAKDYPPMMVRTSLNDSQVMYWEPAKYVAKLRAHKTDQNPLLLRINMAGGHGGASGRYDQLKERAFDFAFVAWQLGIPPKAPRGETNSKK